MSASKTNPIVRSAIWSAYGDALGFMTELADRSGVRRRTGQDEVTSLQSWTRRIGGKYGTDIKLPAGCYSDDTQLRIATARAIRRDGTLDVEVFAKVELPVWRAYALGAGRGTKAAAESLSKRSVHWPSNFYDARGARYIDSGGNGGAMRIQPHAWVASSDEDPGQLLREIVRNCVTTHGHPTAILGACFHGLCVHHTIRKRSVPQAKHLQEMVSYLRVLPEVFASDEQLGTIWQPLWEKASSRPLSNALLQAQKELSGDLSNIERCLPAAYSIASIQSSYREAVDALDATRAEWRGSATKTAVLAAFLSLVGQAYPQEAMLVAANTLNTDTDSIATMAGAIIGVTASNDPPEQVMDARYICDQANHLSEHARGYLSCTHSYPDLMRWSPPKAALDIVGTTDGGYSVSGLGFATAKEAPIENVRQKTNQWLWLELSLGQTVLAKMRTNPKPIPEEAIPVARRTSRPVATPPSTESSLFPSSDTSVKKNYDMNTPSLDTATDQVISSGFDPRLIGDMLLKFAASPSGINGAVAFAAIVAKAKTARIKRDRK